METSDSLVKLGKMVSLLWGLGLVVYASFLIYLSQAGMCLREISLNTRREGSLDDCKYKIFEWVCYIFLIVGFCSVLVGVFLVLGGL